PGIIGVKEASGDLDQIGLVCASKPDGFKVWSGDDSWTLPIMAVGGHGVICVVSHIAGRSMARLIEAYRKGENDVARDIHHGLLPTRTQAVPGAGPCPSNILIVGEAPGFNEDRQGEPFVGAAGKLLDTLLNRIGLSRADVYITNVLKCRPPMNRDPMPNEAEACSPYLKQQVELVQPKVVLILGRHALERLMPGQGSISRIHGSLIRRGDIAYVPLYHP